MKDFDKIKLTKRQLKKIISESTDDGVITTDMIIKKLMNHGFFKSHMHSLEYKMAKVAAENIVFGTKHTDWDYDNESQYVFDRIQHIAEVLVSLMERDGYYLAKKQKEEI